VAEELTQAPYQPIEKQKTYELDAKELLTRISEQQLLSGDGIPSERELVGLYRVSRSSVREALRVLESIGMIEQRTNGSFVVSAYTRPLNNSFALLLTLDQANLTEVFEMRRVLECEAAAFAAERWSERDIQAMDDALHTSTQALETNSAELFVDADLRFHLAVAQASGNRVISHTMSATRDLLRQVFTAMFTVAGPPEQSIQQHREIRDAIRAADPDAARNAMRDHLRTVEQGLEAQQAAEATARKSATRAR
jgi:GntR family transcriptional repressor for pyruvate dehydrogenase complex